MGMPVTRLFLEPQNTIAISSSHRNDSANAVLAIIVASSARIDNRHDQKT